MPYSRSKTETEKGFENSFLSKIPAKAGRNIRAFALRKRLSERQDSITDNSNSSQPASWKEQERKKETFGIWLATAEWVPIASRKMFLCE